MYIQANNNNNNNNKNNNNNNNNLNLIVDMCHDSFVELRFFEIYGDFSKLGMPKIKQGSDSFLGSQNLLDFEAIKLRRDTSQNSPCWYICIDLSLQTLSP